MLRAESVCMTCVSCRCNNFLDFPLFCLNFLTHLEVLCYFLILKLLHSCVCRMSRNSIFFKACTNMRTLSAVTVSAQASTSYVLDVKHRQDQGRQPIHWQLCLRWEHEKMRVCVIDSSTEFFSCSGMKRFQYSGSTFNIQLVMYLTTTSVKNTTSWCWKECAQGPSFDSPKKIAG